MLESMEFGIWLVSFQVRENLIRSTEVDLYGMILLKDSLRSKLLDDQ